MAEAPQRQAPPALVLLMGLNAGGWPRSSRRLIGLERGDGEEELLGHLAVIW